MGAARFVFQALIALTLLNVPIAFAAPNSGITYHGRIVRPDGRPLEGAEVQFKMQIRSPGNENCLLFEEIQKKNMLGSNGIFSITINDGSRIGGVNTGISLDRVFQNRGSFTGLADCSAGSSYATNPLDGRKFIVEFRDESMGSWELLPTSLINFTPLAFESRSLGGFNASHLLRVTDNGAVAGNPQDAPVLTVNEANELKALAGGTSTRYMHSSSGGGAALPSYEMLAPPASPVAGSIWYDSDTKAIKFFDGDNPITLGTGSGSGTVTSVTAGDGLSGGTFTVSGTISLSDVGTAGTYYKVTTDAKGRVSSGVTSLAETDLPTISIPGKVSGVAITSGEIAGTTSINTSGAIRTTGTLSSGSFSTRLFDLYDSDNSHRIRFQTPATGDLTDDYTLTWPMTAGTSGQVLTTNGSGVLTWETVSGAPTGSAGGDLDGSYPNPTLREIVTADTGTKITYDAKGRVVSSTTLGASDIPDLNWSKITAGKPTTLSGYGITDAVVLNAGGVVSVQSGDDADKPAFGTPGRVYLAIDTQKIYRDSGASWDVVASVDAGGGGGGGTVTNVTASAPLSSSGGVDPNITISQATTSTDGYLSSTDWNTFNSKLGAIAGSTLNSGQIWVGDGSNQAAAVTPVGDVQMSNTGSFTVTGIRGRAVSATQATLPGQVLRYDDSTTSYIPAFLSLADIRSTTSPFHSMFPDTSCTAAQTLNWSSLTDTLTCTSIAISSSQISDLGSMATEASSDYLSKSGNLTGLANTATARTNLGLTTTGDALATAADAAAARTAIDALGDSDTRLAPSPTGNATNYIRVNSGGTAYEARTPANVLSDIGAMAEVAPGTSGNVLISDGNDWTSAPLSIDGSNFGSQTANRILAAPDSANGNPSFRALVANDIPNLNASKITAGTLPVARGGTGRTSFSNNAVMVTNGSGAPSVGLTCATSGHVMRWSGSAWECAAINQGVTSVATGTGLTGGTITGTGTISLANTAVTTGSYGSANQVATFTVDQQGRLTAAGNTSIGSLNASAVTAGTFGVDRIPTLTAAKIPNLDASKITTGTLGADRIPNLNASKITAGTIATARLGSGTASSSTFLRGDGTWQAVNSGGGITSCPSGWTMIGNAGRKATYCIETNERAMQNYFGAKNTCNNINDATLGRAHLCTHNEWYTACVHGSGLSNMTNNSEWVADFGNLNHGITVGSSSCSNFSSSGTIGTHMFRCCLR